MTRTREAVLDDLGVIRERIIWRHRQIDAINAQIDGDRQTEMALQGELDEIDAAEDAAAVVDLGGPGGGRYWRVTTGEPADHPDAHYAAVMARVTGSVGCTYNDVTVERADAPEGD